MMWNVFAGSGGIRRRWLGTVEGRDEQEARHAALSKFDIPAGEDFDVSPR